MKTGLTRTQLRNRNRRARRKALKACIECEANFIEREAMIPCKLAHVNRKTSQYRVKRKGTTCVNRKDKPACDSLREAITRFSDKCEANKNTVVTDLL